MSQIPTTLVEMKEDETGDENETSFGWKSRSDEIDTDIPSSSKERFLFLDKWISSSQTPKKESTPVERRYHKPGATIDLASIQQKRLLFYINQSMNDEELKERDKKIDEWQNNLLENYERIDNFIKVIHWSSSNDLFIIEKDMKDIIIELKAKEDEWCEYSKDVNLNSTKYLPLINKTRRYEIIRWNRFVSILDIFFGIVNRINFFQHLYEKNTIMWRSLKKSLESKNVNKSPHIQWEINGILGIIEIYRMFNEYFYNYFDDEKNKQIEKVSFERIFISLDKQVQLLRKSEQKFSQYETQISLEVENLRTENKRLTDLNISLTRKKDEMIVNEFEMKEHILKLEKKTNRQELESEILVKSMQKYRNEKEFFEEKCNREKVEYEEKIKTLTDKLEYQSVISDSYLEVFDSFGTKLKDSLNHYEELKKKEEEQAEKFKENTRKLRQDFMRKTLQIHELIAKQKEKIRKNDEQTDKLQLELTSEKYQKEISEAKLAEYRTMLEVKKEESENFKTEFIKAEEELCESFDEINRMKRLKEKMYKLLCEKDELGGGKSKEFRSSSESIDSNIQSSHSIGSEETFESDV